MFGESPFPHSSFFSMKYDKITNLISDLNKFGIGEIVYHITSADKGRVVNWRLHGNYKLVDYIVSFGPNNSTVMEEVELTRDKPIL